ncbi:hypothetical protein [uncultured Fusobacterium sp.]|uniref:hypothetical protein n=1 Tax=uncultured Fusobacterium sp. TaxID=159267 RepID=UPI0025F8FE09|nr:hypothetical protein [uncultured Fusobacterium sp.]
MDTNKSLKDFIVDLNSELNDLEIKSKKIKIRYINQEIEANIDILKVYRTVNGKLQVFFSFEDKELFDLLQNKNFIRNSDGFLDGNNIEIEYFDKSYPILILIKNTICISSSNNWSLEINKNIYTMIFETLEEVIYKKEYEANSEKKVLKEWYTNALPHIKLFLQSEKEEYHFNYINGRKKRKRIWSNFSNNLLKLNLRDFSINVKIENMKDKNKISIEYSNIDGNTIPTSEVREKISEMLSFIMDRKLIKLGETVYNYDENNEYDSYVLKETIRFSTNELSRLNEFSEVFFGDEFYMPSSHNSLKEECLNLNTELEKMIINYLQLSDKYKLSNILNRYFQAKIIYYDYGIPIIVTGLEMLSNILATENNIDKIISKEKFDIFLKQVNDFIPIELSKKIINLNNTSIGDKLKYLVEKFELDYEKYRFAFNTRNKLNHGSTHIKSTDIIASYTLLRELVILIFIKILDFKYPNKFQN